MKDMNSLNPELKSVVEWITNRFSAIINIGEFRGKVKKFISKHYYKALEDAEAEFNINFIPDDRDLEFLNDYVFNNLKFATDEIGDKIRGEVSRGILNKEKISGLKKRIKGVLKGKEYENRIKTVLRTEGQRAVQTGRFQGMKQAPFKIKKYLDVNMDDRTSPICKAMNKKYGSKDKAIPLDDYFSVKVDNKVIKELTSPLHPNCRTDTRYIKEGKE